MKYSREKLVQLVQCVGLELIKNADKYIDDADGKTGIEIGIKIMNNGVIDIPSITVYQEHMLKESLPVYTDTMDFTEVFDNYILDRAEKGETYKTFTSSDEINRLKSFAEDF